MNTLTRLFGGLAASSPSGGERPIEEYAVFREGAVEGHERESLLGGSGFARGADADLRAMGVKQALIAFAGYAPFLVPVRKRRFLMSLHVHQASLTKARLCSGWARIATFRSSKNSTMTSGYARYLKGHYQHGTV